MTHAWIEVDGIWQEWIPVDGTYRCQWPKDEDEDLSTEHVAVLSWE
jgi:hypothetical protein